MIINDDIQSSELSHLHYQILKDLSGKLSIDEVSSSVLNDQFYAGTEEYNYVKEVLLPIGSDSK